MNTAQEHQVSIFGQTNFRDTHKLFGIRQADRMAHMYVIGKTGTGKSTMLHTLIRQDIESGRGMALIDPHGDLVEVVASEVADNRRADLLYFDVTDASRPMAFNPLQNVLPEKRALAAAGLLEVFKKIWADTWGPRLEHILRNTLLTLLDQPQATLADILRLLDDYRYRREAIARVENRHVRDFWLREYEAYPERYRVQVIAPIQNKVGAFLSNPILSRILTQPQSDFDMRSLMDKGKILLVNLAKGKIGEDATALMGALLVSSLGLTALSRAGTPADDRRPFFLYLDEFQTFATLSLANMLSELRKYGLGMVLAHQYLDQIDNEIRDAILGNVGTVITFRLGLSDAQYLSKEFHPVFSGTDLINLPNYNVYLKLMIDSVVSRPFSARMIAPSELFESSL